MTEGIRRMKDALAPLLIPTDEDVHCGISLHQPLTAAIHLPVEPFPLEGRVKDQKPVEAAVGGKQMLSEFAENGVSGVTTNPSCPANTFGTKGTAPVASIIA